MANFKVGSRYSNGTFTLNTNNQEFLILRETLTIPESGQDTFLIVEGTFINRPDLLSTMAYGRPDLFWAIMDINQIREPLFQLQVGDSLRVPPLNLVLDAIKRLNLGQ